MKRGHVRALVFVTASAIALLFAGTLLYSEPGDTKHFSQSVTPDKPAKDSGKEKPSLTEKRPFSDQFLPEPYKGILDSHFPSKGVKTVFHLQEWSPDPRIHHHIAELRVREDIDYKIRKVGR